MHEYTNPMVLLEFVRDIRQYRLQEMATEIQTEVRGFVIAKGVS